MTLDATSWPGAAVEKDKKSANRVGSLGTRIRTLREAGGLTQTDLAGAIGVTQAALSAWEAGNSLNLKLQTF